MTFKQCKKCRASEPEYSFTDNLCRACNARKDKKTEEDLECPVCGRDDFKNEKGRNVHLSRDYRCSRQYELGRY